MLELGFQGRRVCIGVWVPLGFPRQLVGGWEDISSLLGSFVLRKSGQLALADVSWEPTPFFCSYAAPQPELPSGCFLSNMGADLWPRALFL